jgi:hypothetical protein
MCLFRRIVLFFADVTQFFRTFGIALNPFAQSLGVLFGIAFMAASDIELKPQPKDDKANQNDKCYYLNYTHSPSDVIPASRRRVEHFQVVCYLE